MDISRSTIRIAPLLLGVVLASLLISFSSAAAEFRAVQLESDKGFVRLLLEFDELPRYELRELGCFGDVGVLLYDTKARAGLALPSARFPIISLDRYQGRENLLLSLNLAGDWPRLVERRDYELVISFPQSFSITRRIPLPAVGTLVIERKGNATALEEVFWVKLAPDAVSKRLALATAADHGARTLALSELASREKAVLAVNAGFFDAGGTPVGLVIADGKLAALPVKPDRPALVVDTNGRASIIRPRLELWLEADERRVLVDGFNQPSRPGSVIAYSRLFLKAKLVPNAIYYRLSLAGIETLSYDDVSRADFDDFFLAVNLPLGADPFADAEAITFHWRLLNEAGSEIPVRFAISGAPLLVDSGQVSITSEFDDVPATIADSVRARTAIGVDRDGSVFLLVAREDDARGVPGLSLQELAKKLVEIGAWTALNLDGGGSSELALAGVPLNLPYAKERSIPTSLVVK